MLLESFEVADVPTPRGDVHARIGGSGPPLLLLHGFPETHLMWHGVAPGLLEHFTVAVAGHDRGGRVGYRMALDHSASVSRLAVLDIVPTGEIWSRADAAFAIGYWHWSFLAQPAPLPEQMILGDPDAFWMSAQRLGLGDDPRYPQEVLNAYRSQCEDPATVEAICEDYRAGATIDRQLDHADRGHRTIACPVLALWGNDGALPRFYDDPLDLWRVYAPQLTGHAVQNASHFLVEDLPGVIAEELLAFFGNGARATSPIALPE